MKNNDLDKDFYKVQEFADLLRVHRNTILKSIKEAHILAFRVGNGKKSSFRIPHSEIERMALFDLTQIAKTLKEE